MSGGNLFTTGRGFRCYYCDEPKDGWPMVSELVQNQPICADCAREEEVQAQRLYDGDGLDRFTERVCLIALVALGLMLITSLVSL